MRRPLTLALALFVASLSFASGLCPCVLAGVPHVGAPARRAEVASKPHCPCCRDEAAEGQRAPADHGQEPCTPRDRDDCPCCRARDARGHVLAPDVPALVDPPVFLGLAPGVVAPSPLRDLLVASMPEDRAHSPPPPAELRAGVVLNR